MAASAAATTFVRTPSRPACIAATTPASASLSSTGTQSATSTQSTSPRAVVTRESVSGTGPSCGPSTTTTPLPCTCVIQTRCSPGTPSSRARRSRLAATSSGRSPTCAPRLKESYGDADRPPRRSVTTLRGRTAGRAAGSVVPEVPVTDGGTPGCPAPPRSPRWTAAGGWRTGPGSAGGAGRGPGRRAPGRGGSAGTAAGPAAAARAPDGADGGTGGGLTDPYGADPTSRSPDRS